MATPKIMTLMTTPKTMTVMTIPKTLTVDDHIQDTDRDDRTQDTDGDSTHGKHTSLQDLQISGRAQPLRGRRNYDSLSATPLQGCKYYDMEHYYMLQSILTRCLQARLKRNCGSAESVRVKRECYCADFIYFVS